ncbi:PilZ domain-containing protein [Azospira restricta]|uniref:PilZ domain-containing protein n=1 Tax=Azospira restricta TaxID=404405 RepID=A0A974Y563_9RHOO|nr:PilZ domain-containing protein [Azospira restricta]QRJ65031.1 PilZ domain-containing protein [Azospira restricta]
MKDSRSHPRYLLRWRAALVFDGQATEAAIEGKTYDLSLGGATLLTHEQVRDAGSTTLLLTPPPLLYGQPQKVIVVQARLVYSVHSDAHMCFRTGLHFIRFEDCGQRLLEDRLGQHVPALEALVVGS